MIWVRSAEATGIYSNSIIDASHTSDGGPAASIPTTRIPQAPAKRILEPSPFHTITLL